MEDVYEVHPINPPNALLGDQAILIATEEELEEVSPWYTTGKYEFRFVRVPQFLFNTAAAHLRSRMRKMKPKPPVIRKSGREMTNKADPYYIESLERWKQEWEDLVQEANLSTGMFAGIELRHGVPTEDQWLPEVIKNFETVGMTEGEAFSTYYHDRDRLLELWFKKFIILKSKAVTNAFSEFQGGDDVEEEEEGFDGDEDAAFAADLFPTETG